MYASIFNKPCFLTVLHTSPYSIPQRQWCEFFTNHVSVSCSRAVSIHTGLFLSWSTAPAYLSDIRRVKEEQRRGARQSEEEMNERSPSLQEPDINQTNYGATTVSNPRRGNEMIRGRSQLNTERVNENINYLMIYWESGVPPHPPHIFLPLIPPYHREHLF